MIKLEKFGNGPIKWLLSSDLLNAVQIIIIWYNIQTQTMFPFISLIRIWKSSSTYTFTNAVNRSISLGTNPVRFFPDKSLATIRFSSTYNFTYESPQFYDFNRKQMEELNLHFRNSYGRSIAFTDNSFPLDQKTRIGNPIFYAKLAFDSLKSFHCIIKTTWWEIEP
jgi:hypothetical protein